jgi:hypothetical protein
MIASAFYKLPHLNLARQNFRRKPDLNTKGLKSDPVKGHHYYLLLVKKYGSCKMGEWFGKDFQKIDNR